MYRGDEPSTRHRPERGAVFSVLSRSCLKQRLPSEEALSREIDALVRERNNTRTAINWRFSARDTRHKLRRLYPSHSTVD